MSLPGPSRLASWAFLALCVGLACARTKPPQPIVWPPNAAVIEVLPTSDAPEARPLEPSLFIRYAGEAIFAQEVGGASHPLPREMSVLLGGWVDGVSVTWDREACVLGGHVRRGEEHLPVDGGFCFHGDTRTWRVVRLRPRPLELQPAHGPGAERSCRTVMIGEERAVSCSHRSGGGLGSQCNVMIPITETHGTYRFLGLR